MWHILGYVDLHFIKSQPCKQTPAIRRLWAVGTGQWYIFVAH